MCAKCHCNWGKSALRDEEKGLFLALSNRKPTKRSAFCGGIESRLVFTNYVQSQDPGLLRNLLRE